MPYTYKVLLVGEPEVGKSSLVARFVHHAFDPRYLKTLGTVISRHTARLVVDGAGEEVNLILWDLMGQSGALELLEEAYFHGARGALAVFDVTRPPTLVGLRRWIDAALRHDPRMPLVVLGNKADLAAQRVVQDEEAKAFCVPRGLPYLPTSAKTGQNVEEAFALLARRAVGTYAAAVA